MTSKRLLKQPMLEPGENILWEGRPVCWRAAVPYLPTAVFGIPMSAFSYLLYTDPGGSRNAGFWVAFSMVTFFAIMAVTAPLQAWLLARGTTYVLTNRRALVLSPSVLRSCSVESYRLSDCKLQFGRRRKGSGEILFARYGMGGRLGFKNLRELSVAEPLVRALVFPTQPMSSRADTQLPGVDLISLGNSIRKNRP